MRILVVNAGSSSLKLRVLGDGDELVATSDLPAVERAGLRSALDAIFDECPDIDAVGHRVVHGGSLFRRPVLLDAGTDDALRALGDLAPLHNPPSLAAIHELRSSRPDLPQVACFDTTFHADMPPKATTYAVPRAWREQLGIRRYGFHGLSHAWASRRAAELLNHPLDRLRLVTAHLGAGASLAAVASGRSVDTTMGFTPMDGLVMATRPGSIDPGAVLWAQRHGRLSTDQVDHALENQSGLLGLSGISGDLRLVLEAADAGDPGAQLAYDVYVYRIQAGVGAMAVALGGIDALVFTGGAGEGSPRLRTDTRTGLRFLGVPSGGGDEEAEPGPVGDRLLSPAGRMPAVVLVQAREDLEIARHVRELLGRDDRSGPAAGG